jgi:hypothetical protein
MGNKESAYDAGKSVGTGQMSRALLFLFFAIASSLGSVGQSFAAPITVCWGEFENQGQCILKKGDLACVSANFCQLHPYDKFIKCEDGGRGGANDTDTCNITCGHPCTVSPPVYQTDGNHCGYSWARVQC